MLLLAATQISGQTIDGSDQISDSVERSRPRFTAGRSLQALTNHVRFRDAAAARFCFNIGDQLPRQSYSKDFHQTDCITSMTFMQYKASYRQTAKIVIANAGRLGCLTSAGKAMRDAEGLAVGGQARRKTKLSRIAG